MEITKQLDGTYTVGRRTWFIRFPSLWQAYNWYLENAPNEPLLTNETVSKEIVIEGCKDDFPSGDFEQ